MNCSFVMSVSLINPFFNIVNCFFVKSFSLITPFLILSTNSFVMSVSLINPNLCLLLKSIASFCSLLIPKPIFSNNLKLLFLSSNTPALYLLYNSLNKAASFIPAFDKCTLRIPTSFFIFFLNLLNFSSVPSSFTNLVSISFTPQTRFFLPSNSPQSFILLIFVCLIHFLELVSFQFVSLGQLLTLIQQPFTSGGSVCFL